MLNKWKTVVLAGHPISADVKYFWLSERAVLQLLPSFIFGCGG